MAYEVIIPGKAEQDIDEAILWYEEQQTGLGIKFYYSLLEKLEKLKVNPQNYYCIHEEYRRIVIDPFPYNIIYKIYNSTILILAVFHHSRNPVEILKRVKK